MFQLVVNQWSWLTENYSTKYYQLIVIYQARFQIFSASSFSNVRILLLFSVLCLCKLNVCRWTVGQTTILYIARIILTTVSTADCIRMRSRLSVSHGGLSLEDTGGFKFPPLYFCRPADVTSSGPAISIKHWRKVGLFSSLMWRLCLQIRRRHQWRVDTYKTVIHGLFFSGEGWRFWQIFTFQDHTTIWKPTGIETKDHSL